MLYGTPKINRGGGIHFLIILLRVPKKRQNKKTVYPRYTAPCLTKIYYFLLRDLLRVCLVLMGSGGYHFLKNRLKPHFLPSVGV